MTRTTTGTLSVNLARGGTQQAVTVNVKVLGGRIAFGRQELLVSPVGGYGQAWVSADRVKIGGR